MSLSPPSAELLERLDRVAAGDRAATVEFVDEFGGLVRGFLRRFDQLTVEDREELAQDVLLAAMESLERYDRNRRFIPWLLTIAKHKALDRLREDRDEWTAGEFGTVPTTTPLRDQAPPEGRADGGATRSNDAEGDDAGGRARPDAYESAIATEAEAGDAHEEAAEVGGVPVAAPARVVYNAELLAGLRAWLAGLPIAEQIVATRFTHGMSYPEVAAKLSEHLGSVVTHGAARVRGTRFAEKVRKRFGHLL